MSLLDSLWLAWDSLRSNKLRSLLTMLGIIIGVGSVIAIFAIGRGTEAAVRGELSGIGSGQIVLMPGEVGPQSANQRIEYFTENDLVSLRNLLPDVESAVTAYGASAPVKYARESMTGDLAGHYAEAGVAFDIKVGQGRWFSLAEDASGTRVVVLGDGAAKKLIGEGVPAVGKTVSIGGYPFQVIGVTEKQGGMLASALGAEDNTLYVPATWLRRMLGNPPITQVFIKARDGANTKQLLEDAVALVKRNHHGAPFRGESFDQYVEMIAKVLSVITGVLAAVAGISLVVGGVGIMNIMLVSVTERTREIGIRKACGARYRDILAQFLVEAIMLSLVGGLIGVGLASLPVWVVGRWLKIALLLDWSSIALALGFSVGVGVLFGVYPASKAARMDPIEALRFE